MSTQVVTLRLSISNAYLVLGDRPVLIDAGAPGDGDKLVSALREHGVTPRDLSLIALTHGHTDHAGSVAVVAADNAPVAVGAQDAEMVAAGTNGPLSPTGPAGAMMRPVVRRTKSPGWQPQLALTDVLRLDDYGVGGEMVPAGGHTPGSYVVHLDNGDALVGDMIRGGFASGRIRPARPLRHYFIEERVANRESLRRVLERNPRRILVGHGGPLDADDVRRRLDAVT